MEENSHTQTNCIIKLEVSVDGQTVLTESTDYAASVVTTGGANKNLKEMRAIMKQLTDSVTAQAATLAALYFRTNSGGGDGKTPKRIKCGQACTFESTARRKSISKTATAWS